MARYRVNFTFYLTYLNGMINKETAGMLPTRTYLGQHNIEEYNITSDLWKGFESEVTILLYVSDFFGAVGKQYFNHNTIAAYSRLQNAQDRHP